MKSYKFNSTEAQILLDLVKVPKQFLDKERQTNINNIDYEKPIYLTILESIHKKLTK